MIYQTIDQMWMQIIEKLLGYGNETSSRVGKTKEIIAYKVILTNIEATFLLNKRRRLSPSYACAEYLWYMSLTDDIEMILAYAPQYHKFAEGDVAHGAYGARLRDNVRSPKNQLELVIEHLRQDPDSRQAIVTFWNANDLLRAIAKDAKDIPCTLSLQFLVRENKLHMITTMRSNDAWLGLPYDVFAFTCLQRLVADTLGREYGTYTHQAGSMHLYEKNWQAAEEALNGTNYSIDDWNLKHSWSHCQRPWRSYVQSALCAEKLYRKGLNGIVEHRQLNGMLCDLVSCCAYKFGYTTQIYSPVLRQAMKNSKGEK